MDGPTRVLALARQALLRTQALYDLARTLTQAGSEDDVLHRVVSAPTTLLGVHRAVLITLNPEAELVRHFLVAGPGARYVQRPDWEELQGGLTGWALRERRVAVSPANYLDPRESPAVQARRQQTQCGGIVVLPLLLDGAVYGTLTVIHTPQAGDFSDDEVAWLEALTFQAMAALEGLRHAREQPQMAAPFDGLTGLPTALLADDRLRQAVARSRATHAPFALLLVDIGSLTEVNGRYGRASGDALLTQVAARLQDVVRPPNTVARRSGDGFMVLVEDLPGGSDARGVTALILGVFGAPFEVSGEALRVTASVGVALFPVDGTDPASLQQRAQVTLQQGKALGDPAGDT
ncbi:sensor domain-containing diguanylate cyclase [Deinococcus hopiensis]|uniref:Diguanylate cyclase (GGDEF) domain-containing protein n=1 Tax=Deinococcus hopiensis KR-140 TaxID=695939 RepID=A0A1W1VDS3_9DEIO|nr:sensor domain-containing diguanylate cyclase [Deinococcus hopiensis]SMB91363.1 diguanylate cyclase (GGDEF) domain-containing protein [Deinococcus hopiensis KR-140]